MKTLDSISLIFIFLISLIASIGLTGNAIFSSDPVYIILSIIAVFINLKSFYILWNRATK